MNKFKELRECADCRFFEPATAEHLCLKGKCFVEFGKAPKDTDRHNHCDKCELIDERGSE